MPRKGSSKELQHVPAHRSDVWHVLTELLGDDPATLGVCRTPIQTFRAYVFAGPAPVPRSEYTAKVFKVYDGIPYYRPDGWWQLRVEPFCAHGYVRARSDFEEIRDWPIAYHGTHCDSLASILESGLRKPKELEGVLVRHGGYGAGPNGSIYLSPSLWYASHPVYSTIKQIGRELWAQVVLKLRVRPESYRTQKSTLLVKHWGTELSFDPNLPGGNSMEWLVDGSSVKRTDCVIVGIMIRQIGWNASQHIFGQCPRLFKQRRGKSKYSGPDFEWTHYLQGQFRSGGYWRDDTMIVPYDVHDSFNDWEDDAIPVANFDTKETDGVLLDRRGVSTAETAARSADQLEAPGIAAIIETLLAKFGMGLLSGKWTVPQRMEKLLLEKVRQSLVRGEPIRDGEDARSRYDTLLNRVRKHAEGSKTLDTATLLSWHGLYMKGIHPACGQLRERGITCGEYPYPPPAMVEALVEEYTREAIRITARGDLSAPTKAAWCHYHIVRIHPFADGNGRMGRLMAIWALARHGLPWKLCLVPLFQDNPDNSMCNSRKEYVEAHLIAARPRDVQSADIRPFAVHICRCLLASLQACEALPPGIDMNAFTQSLKQAKDAVVARSSRPAADYLARAKVSATEPPTEHRMTATQWDVLRSFAERAPSFDFEQNPEGDWSPITLPVCWLRSTHKTVSAIFRRGPHAGERIADLTRSLQEGYSPSLLPPLVAVAWRSEYWVIAGNRRLRALKDFSPAATARVIVYDGHDKHLPAPVLAKLMLAMTVEPGSESDSTTQVILEDCVSEPTNKLADSTTDEYTDFDSFHVDLGDE